MMHFQITHWYEHTRYYSSQKLILKVDQKRKKIQKGNRDKNQNKLGLSCAKLSSSWG